MDAATLIQKLDLKPLPFEGGYYRETYRSAETIPAEALPPRYTHDKHYGTAIYYLLTPDTFSALHRLPTDEIFHFYLGDPVTMLQLHPDGHGETLTLGPDLARGQLLQAVAPKNAWQGTFLNEGGRFALMGVTVAPAFDFEDFQLASRADLLNVYNEYRTLIERLTKE